MKKILVLLIIISAFSIQSAMAEKIPVRITPFETISTHHDEVEVGDWIRFKITNDVYYKDKLYIKKDTPVYGLVDYFYPNGWTYDKAEIKLKKFETKNIYGQKITIIYTLNIDGNSDKEKNFAELFTRVVLAGFRGSEILIEPNEKIFNIFITQ